MAIKTISNSDIIQEPHPTLRKKAKLVDIKTIHTPEFAHIVKKMSAALAKEKDGVALAAPQINESLQMFIVAGRVMEMVEQKLSVEDVEHSKRPDVVFINPVIVKRSKKTRLMDEGCLSVRYKYGKIKRSTNVTIEAINEHGEKISRGAGGLLAQIFQHETDHLHGILFIDSATGVEDMPPHDHEAKTPKEMNSKDHA